VIYQFKQGARVPSNVKPEETAAELHAIKERHGGLTTEAVATDVEAAPEAHPLRWAFTWDEESGMHKLHVIEAGNLIRMIVVKEIVPEQREPVRAYVVVRESGESKHYEPTEYAVRHVDLWDQVLSQAQAEFDAAERKRKELFALMGVARHSQKIAS